MPPRVRAIRIISGGQTGVDRAALDVAMALGLGCGGWVPRGRRAEDGAIASHYPLRETASRGYPQRTRRNVRDADAILIIARGMATGGTALTIATARALNRPLLIVDLLQGPDPAAVGTWLAEIEPAVLNIAGPRESISPGIYEEAREFLERVFADASGEAMRTNAAIRRSS